MAAISDLAAPVPAAPHPPDLRRVAIGAMLVFGVSALAVLASRGRLGLDSAVHHWITAHSSAGLRHAARVGKQPGTRWVYFSSAGAAIVAGVVARRSLRPVVLVVGVVALEIIVIESLKVAFGRGAPTAGGLALHVGGKGFPSGHAANPLLALGLLGWWLARLPALGPAARRALLLLGPVVSVVTGVSMLLLDYHWLTDNIAGWALGTLALCLAIWLDGRPLHPAWRRLDQRLPEPVRASH